MKQKLFTANFYAALFAAGLLFISLTVSAQVKIGLNPTTIGANSNLEVEGASGYKTIVDKNGKVTILDGSQADGRVLTSNPVGLATWKYPLNESMVNGPATTYVNVTTYAVLTNTNSGGVMQFPKAGTYLVYGVWESTGGTTNYTIPGQCFINMSLSSSNTSNIPVGRSLEWTFIAGSIIHSFPPFRVTVTAGQILYFWYQTGWYQGSLRLNETYAVGPF